MSFMLILSVDLEKKEIRKRECEDMPSLFLMHRLSEEDSSSILFSSTKKDALKIRGGATFAFSFFSVYKNARYLGFTTGLLGHYLSHLGYSMLEIKGKSTEPVYLRISSNDCALLPIEEKELSQDDFSSSYAEKGDLVLSTGKAADRNIDQSALYLERREVGHAGFGKAFSEKNLKGIVFSHIKLDNVRKEDQKYISILLNTPLSRAFRKTGSSALVCTLSRKEALPSPSFLHPSDPRSLFLGSTILQDKYGVYFAACSDCPLPCRMVNKDGYYLPDLDAVLSLGTRLDIFDPESVMELKRLCYETGLSVPDTGISLSSSGITGLERAEEGILDLFEKRKVFPHGSFMIGGIEPDVDIRGLKEKAIFMMIGESLAPYYSLFLQKSVKNDRSNAILALYERIYSYTLAERGLPLLVSYMLFVSMIPGFVYHFPRLLSFFLSKVSFYGISGKVLRKEGLELISLFAEEDNKIPDHFLFSSTEKGKDRVSAGMLMMHYRREKSKLERKLLKSGKRGKRKQ